jgi:hypothetical protein
MNAKQDLLERAAELFPAPEPAFERLARRRDRKRRRQRVVVALVALALAAAAIGNVLVAFRGDVRPRPADRMIDSHNVGRLTLQWQAQAPHIGVGWVGGMSAGEGVLLLASSHRLSAYDESCATNGDRCTPMWTAPGSFGPLFSEGVPWGSALIADGVAYAPSREGLVAFPLRCRTDGGDCEPMWVSAIDGDFTSSRMALVDGELYGSFYDLPTGTGAVFAMPASCDSSTCPMDWVAHAPSGGRSLIGVSGERVIAGAEDHTLAAFATDCRSDGRECAPVWTAPLPPRGYVVGIDDQNAYVRQPRGMLAYPVSCGGPACAPRWFAPGAIVFDSAQVGGGMAFASSAVVGGRLLAYAPDCGSGGEACRPSWRAPAWTARSDGSVSVLVAEGTVLAETHSGVAAFPVRCRDDGGVCPPRWVSDGPRPSVEGGTVSNGVLFAWVRSGVRGAGTRDGPAAYPLTCAADGGRCAAAWTWRLPGEGRSYGAPLVDGDHVYLVVRASPFTGTPTYIYAFGLPRDPSPTAREAAP